ncbi:hypothetical protein CYMTET_8142 [Cymbomonas tetramitiformis]|uniref:Uncharacterized protein n=1 Tax=Cymbomonas tetramitiformis TaxID=36881 RepID=A0AAE0GVH8_9CHLO|nr:hypothetical protein CYMTET_8142 [Cymbomonas tetramitiformis]
MSETKADKPESKAAEQPEFGNEQAVIQHFQGMRTELGQLWSKIGELDIDRNEHTLVIDAIEPLDATRKCFRLIGGVLVERTVGEVLPAVKKNREGLEMVWHLPASLLSLDSLSVSVENNMIITHHPYAYQVIERLRQQLEKKKTELAEFQAKHKIRIKGEDAPEDSSQKASTSAQPQGVLA